MVLNGFIDFFKFSFEVSLELIENDGLLGGERTLRLFKILLLELFKLESPKPTVAAAIHLVESVSTNTVVGNFFIPIRAGNLVRCFQIVGYEMDSLVPD